MLVTEEKTARSLLEASFSSKISWRGRQNLRRFSVAEVVSDWLQRGISLATRLPPPPHPGHLRGN